jgi:hypothetical protein
MDGKANTKTQQTKTPYVKFVTHANGRRYFTKARRYTHDKLRAIISEKQKKGFVCACIWSGHAIVDGEMINTFVVELDYEKWYHIPAGLLPIEHTSTPYRAITKEGTQ